MTAKHATMRDVARRAKVAVATASKVMNDDQSVRPYLRKRVQVAAEKLKYQPNLMARAMKSGTIKLITCSFTDIDNPFFATLANLLYRDLMVGGYYTVFVQHGREIEAVSRGFRAAGSIMMSASPDHVNTIAPSIPVVTIQGQDPAQQNAPDVCIDFGGPYRQMAEAVIALGRRRIGWYCPPIANLNNRRAKFTHVEAVLALHGLAAVEAPPQLQGEPTQFATAVAARRPELDCIFCHNDVQAVKLMVALERAGLRCPEDTLVVGCDGTFEVEGMATLRVDIPMLARSAVDLLLSQIEGRPVPKRTVYPVHLHLPSIGER